MKLSIKVVPNSAKDEIVGWLGDELKVKIRAVPENGKANKAVMRFLAKSLGVKYKEITLLSGSTSPHKLLNINGIERISLDRILC